MTDTLERRAAEPQQSARATRDGDWPTEPVKVTMTLPAGSVRSIKWLAERLGIPNSHVVRRAVDFRERIQREIDAGANILIEREGKLTQIWFE